MFKAVVSKYIKSWIPTVTKEAFAKITEEMATLSSKTFVLQQLE